MPYTDEHATERAEYIASLQIEYAARFIPQSLSRNRGEKALSLNWRVTLKQGAVTMETDYMQGIGHVPGYPQHLPRTLYFERLRKDYETASEAGTYPHRVVSAFHGTLAETVTPLQEHKHAHGVRLDLADYKLVPLPAPALEEVLYSLVLDAYAVRMTFEDWCGEYGYDTDSRKAHASYMTCSDLGLRLARLVGGYQNLQKLEQLFEGF